MKRNIILIGFMGSGKSTVGRCLADRLGLRFVDSDARIEEKAGRAIPQIFAEAGEAGFRRLEEETIAEIVEAEGQVIATGGGAILSEMNWRRLQEGGWTVWLKAPFDEIWRRVGGSRRRPLLLGEGARERALNLFHEREPLYRRAAFCVDASGSARSVAAIIAAAWRAQEGRHDFESRRG